MKTFTIKQQDIQKTWYLVDANDKIVGRLASKIAAILRGKNKPVFTPHMDTGDNIIVINAEKVRLTGKKWTDKTYYHHTHYPGGIKSITAEKLMEKKPTEVLKHAVKGMLPKNSLGAQLLRNLRIYAGDDHPHSGQTPEKISL